MQSGKTGSEEFNEWLERDLKKRKPNQEELDEQVRQMKAAVRRRNVAGQRKRRKEGR